MWKYESHDGCLSVSSSVILVGVGYSGHGDGVNNPSIERVHDVGPIPRGAYTIGPFVTDPEKGPLAAHLLPKPGTDTFGRSGFMIHGDNSQMNRSASLGCIILPHDVRARIAASGDTDLVVV